MPAPPAITEPQLRALNMAVLSQGGALQNCIVHRTNECHARGGYFIGYPLRYEDGQPQWPSGGAHVCGDCGSALAGRRAFDFPAVPGE